MRRRSAVACLLIVAACSQGASEVVIPTTTSDTIAQTATTALAPRPAVEIDVRPCSAAPPRDWSPLCRSVDLLMEVYVDPLRPDELAAAAVLGVSQAEVGGAQESVGDVFRCTVPGDEFARLCDAILDRRRSGDADTAALVRAAVSGIFQYALDPFSSYVPAAVADGVGDLGVGVVYDLGMSVSARTESGEACGVLEGTCELRVVNVFPLTPAAGAGVLVGDVIVSVDGDRLDGLSADAATGRMFGAPGTAVDIVIERASGTLTKTLVREDFRLDPVEFQMVDAGLAYLRVNEFTQESAQLVGRALQLPEVRRADTMILDIRDNPGGLVLAVQAIASQFLDGGTVMVEIGRDHRFPIEVIDGGLADPSMELLVLVNRGSASATEVLAAVLQERGRATLIGESTFGKNLVQQEFSAGDGGELRITVARWETPGGTDIGVTGLAPDVFVEPDTTGATDPILETALELAGR